MTKNDQFDERELAVLLRELQKVINRGVAGDIVELGCYKGATSVEIATKLQLLQADKKLYLYDSFAGLPEKLKQDDSPAGIQFVAGELPASKHDVITAFKKAHMPVPAIKKGWFSDLTPGDLPDTIALAFLDGDFYDSITDSLRLVWPKLSEGAVVLVDDYQNEALPGAQKAVDTWLKTHPATLLVEASLAVIRQ
jgi:O-methyltransferase